MENFLDMEKCYTEFGKDIYSKVEWNNIDDIGVIRKKRFA